jgi:hypothetical protein
MSAFQKLLCVKINNGDEDDAAPGINELFHNLTKTNINM